MAGLTKPLPKSHTYLRCPECGWDGQYKCPACQKKFVTGASAASLWSRTKEVSDLGLGSTFAVRTDIDSVWFAYKQNWYITIEEKCEGYGLKDDQAEPLRLLAQHLHLGSEKRRLFKMFKQKPKMRHIEYKGFYVVSFEHTSPVDSAWINIYQYNITQQEFLLIREHGPLKDYQMLLQTGAVSPCEKVQHEPDDQRIANIILGLPAILRKNIFDLIFSDNSYQELVYMLKRLAYQNSSQKRKKRFYEQERLLPIEEYIERKKQNTSA